MPHGDTQSGLQQLVVSALVSTFNMRQSGDWLRQGLCPSCGKKELFAHGVNPVLVKCGRLNNCGYEAHVRDVLPDLFVDFNKKYPAKEENPNATANAYMELVRGLNPVKLKGNWTQGTYFNPNGDRATATVKFTIADGVTMERFVEPVTFTKEDGTREIRNQHFTGKHGGLWWEPAGQTIEKGDTVFIVEACIDALSLVTAGRKAVAILSCYNYPEKKLEEHKGKEVNWVWALDNDVAGRKYTRTHFNRLEATGEYTSAALPPAGDKKSDWNDLLIQGRLDDKLIDYGFYLGSLVTAKDATEKALNIWYKTKRNGFDFTFNTRTYWFELDFDKYNKAYNTLIEHEDFKAGARSTQERAARDAGSVREIANCQTTFLYFLANDLTEESWYYARVEFPHGGKPVKNTFTGAALSSASEFKKRLLSFAPGAVFTGSSANLDYIIRDQLYNLKRVQTVDFIGYCKEHKAYIYNDHAVSDGRVYHLNDEDFFEIGKTSVRSLLKSPALTIGTPEQYDEAWKAHFWTAFGVKGTIALAYWIGSYFAEQIRAKHGFYPFLEIIGEAGAGKSTLIEFLWKLSGRDNEEGFDPAKSTPAARARKLSQVSNLPVVLIESDRGDDTAKQKSFDWDEFKTAYNGRATRSRGLKNNGNDTYEPPFRGALVISQNAAVDASEAILQRIIHLHFTKGNHTQGSKDAAEALNNIPVEHVSQFLIKTITQEAKILEHFFLKSDEYERKIMLDPDIRSHRIAKNHGQMMALVDLASFALNLSADQRMEVKKELLAMAIEREKKISLDHTAVQAFWECYEYLVSAGVTIDHANDGGRIAINLNHFVQQAIERRQSIPDLVDLKRHLRGSRRHAFLGIEKLRSAIWKERTASCWIFSAEEKKK